MKPGTCVHFTGIQHDKCKLGYVYDSLDSPLPCIHSYTRQIPKEQRGQQEPCLHGECKDFLAPTAEQVAEADKERKERMAQFAKAMVAVGEWRRDQGWSKTNRVARTGKVPCASCGCGEIHLSMAAYNGHVWGRCTTPGCVSWME